MRAIIFSVLAITLVTACANTGQSLRALRAAGGGPDEFAVIPQRPLALPPSASLPQPTPGGSNLADPNPKAQAIAALGGSSAAQFAGGIPARDNALISQASRYGVTPNIRGELAAADKAFRAGKSRLNIFNPLGRDKYFPAYASQALDARAELARLSAAGVAVPNPQMPRPVVQTRPGQIVVEPAPVVAPRRVRQTCVFTTAGPGNELRRVCTPIEQDQ
jgi:hypothetical protein